MGISGERSGCGAAGERHAVEALKITPMKNQNNNTAPAVVHQPQIRPLRVREDVFGWFDSPEQKTPAHDPGTNGLCPQCCWSVGEHSIDNPVKTISLAIEDRKYRGRSYFFRAHKNCWDRATPHDRMMVESSVIDEEMDFLMNDKVEAPNA